MSVGKVPENFKCTLTSGLIHIPGKNTLLLKFERKDTSLHMHNIHAYVHIYVPPAELKESHNHRCLQQPKHATTIPCTSLLKASCFQVLGWSQRSHKQDTKVLKKAEGRKTEQITTDSLKKNSQEISQVIAQFLLFDTI